MTDSNDGLARTNVIPNDEIERRSANERNSGCVRLAEHGAMK
jgi:hypothetical protein